MIKDLSIEQFKEFVIWAKSQGIKHFALEGVEIAFSDMHLIPVESVNPSPTKTEDELRKEDDETLYWSST